MSSFIGSASPKWKRHSKQIKNMQVQQEMHVQGYKKHSIGSSLFILLSLVSFGIFPLICYWKPKLFVYFARVKSDLLSAEVIGITDQGAYNEADVMTITINEKEMVYFEYKKQRYLIENNMYTPIHAILSGSCQDILDNPSVKSQDANQYLAKYGYNTLDIDPKPLIALILAKLSHPFYIFQSLSVFIWIKTGYFTFAFVILFSSIGSILNEVYLTRKGEKNLEELIPPHGDVVVLRDSQSQKIHASHLVVGDIIVLDEMKNVPGDIVIIKGQAVVDEASLTGESLPVVKNPILKISDTFKIESFKNNVIFAGSDILLVKNDKSGKALGRVYATGFSTTKGDLFKTLLFPKPLEFKFNHDSWKFLGILAVVGLLAFVNRVIQQLGNGISFWNTLLTSADLITIAVPPALPLVLTVGIVLSVDRLRKSKIFCINPERINFAGRIDTMCWDKTGTLTSPTLQFSGVDVFLKGNFTGLKQPDRLSPGMEMVMATCHSVNMVLSKHVGHPLDVAMIAACGYQVEQIDRGIEILEHTLPLEALMKNLNKTGDDLFVIQRCDFDSDLQRATVQVMDSLASDYHFVISKGSAESIQAICRPETIPENYSFISKKYAFEGYYVIACALRRVQGVVAPEKKRHELEADLDFAGFILFSNNIKSETIPTIGVLQEAQIRSIMITGDNSMNAIHVSREIGMLGDALLLELVNGALVSSRVPLEAMVNRKPSLSTPSYQSCRMVDDLEKEFRNCPFSTKIVTTGDVVDMIHKADDNIFLDYIMERCDIFARAKPKHKAFIVEKLISMGKTVGFCGDGNFPANELGTNDCGGLKVAHVGIGLSGTEASTVAPFTSQQKHITDVLKIIREGRCALETSFTAFKFMTLYPIIQLTMAAVLYQLGSAISNNQYLLDDLGIVLFMGIFICWTKPARELTVERPPGTSLS